jgi:hypothetical protein
VTDPDTPRHELYLVQGGTPAAEWLAQRLDDANVKARYRAVFEQQVEQFTRALGASMEQAARLLADLLDGHRRRNDPAHARVRRPPGTVRLTYWHGLPGEPGSVQSRVTVEGLPPDDAARVVEHYRHIVDDDEP